ncbi:hypothetical protein BU16DRAFT_526626 [Lophium mytilinum]|uniref:Uncharacterized protein n=1 Tax=Lophium mytilinum TaxID=390894 RepID=A0A6A6QVE7_9PEZI|nr:hypothetical protein BU16DRAFT_526626 [Lophium mytilinum]
MCHQPPQSHPPQTASLPPKTTPLNTITRAITITRKSELSASAITLISPGEASVATPLPHTPHRPFFHDLESGGRKNYRRPGVVPR